MSALEEARLLWTMADKDRRALHGMLDAEVFDDEVFGFHCQQAAEKALKAWVTLLAAEVPRIHDVAELLSLVEDHAKVPARYEDLIEFNPFAVQHRYQPFEETAEGEIERDVGVALVDDLLNHVGSLLNPP